MDKHINYVARDYASYKDELLNLTKKYYPELAEQENDASVGNWLIDLIAATADNLSYHIDRTYQNTNVNSTNSIAALMNIARANGLKVPGNKGAVCEVEFTCKLPVLNDAPNWDYAPLIKRNTTISNGVSNFELDEDLNFAEQFNSHGFSNRRFEPVYAADGTILYYTVHKSTIARNIERNIYKKTLMTSDIKPFMEVTLPFEGVAGVESVIFKETSNYSSTPTLDDFFINKENYRIGSELVQTRRFFEVDNLTQQYIYNTDNDSVTGGEAYTDYLTEDGTPVTRIYKGRYKGITQKFITEYTDNGYLKIIFGAGANYMPSTGVTANPNIALMSQIVNNDLLGSMPMGGWTMFVLYNTTDGEESNIGPNVITTINQLNLTMPYAASNQQNVTFVTRSIEVTNLTPAYGGSSMPTAETLRNLIKYNNGALGRAVTIKDYKALIANMPAKYGCPYKVAVKEENNKVVISLLNLDQNKKLTTAVPNLMADNLVEWLSMYKVLGDYIEVKSGKIYNLVFNVEVMVDRNYTLSTVLSNVLNKIKDYMDPASHDIGDNIYLSDLKKEITAIDGVVNIIDLGVYNVYNGIYSANICPLAPVIAQGDNCSGTPQTLPSFVATGNAKSFKIDLTATEDVLLSDDDSMFEIKNPNTDIVIKAKLN